MPTLTPRTSGLLLALACLPLGGCLSASQFYGTYATDHQYTTKSHEHLEVEECWTTEVDYDFWGETIKGSRFVVDVRSKVDEPLIVRFKIESPESRRFLSVWHDVEQRLEPGETLRVLNVLVAPWVQECSVEYNSSLRSAR